MLGGLLATLVVSTSCSPGGGPEAATANDGGPVFTGIGGSAGSSTVPEAAPQPLFGHYRVEIVATHPHDPAAFTQGLEWHDGLLLESVGRYGTSARRWVEANTGDVVDTESLPSNQFGEGLTVVGDQIVQLTWQEEVAIVADIDNLEPRSQFRYDGEGWGLCFDDTHLVMSDGSAQLALRDPHSFEIRSTITATRDDSEVRLLNELECRGSQVLANVYGSDEIVVISTATGRVEATIDAHALRPPDLPIENRDFALNGIARRPDTDRFFLTGKWWPILYEVELVPANTDGT